MKKTLFAIVLFISFKTLYGQGFQIGLRAGAVAYFTTDYTRGSIPIILWEKSLYARYEEKNRWAFEINASNNSYCFAHKTDNSTAACWGFPRINGREYYGVIESNNVNMYSLNISPQFRITNKNRSFTDYVGLYTGATIIYEQTTYYNAYFDNNEGFSDKGSKSRYFDIRIGLSNSLFYKISHRLTISNALSFSLSPIVATSRGTGLNDTNPSFNCSLGMGYFLN